MKPPSPCADHQSTYGVITVSITCAACGEQVRVGRVAYRDRPLRAALRAAAREAIEELFKSGCPRGPRPTGKTP